ncbi:MAG: COQ9 family protein [Rhodospirillales bacterium]|nr:COQ9 family protein [Rhodospirillales bacterium]
MAKTPTEAQIQATKMQILDCALRAAPFDGWTPKLLKVAGREAGADEDAIHRMFPGGVADLAAYFSAEFDRRMGERLSSIDIQALPVYQRIAAGVRARLELLEPHREAVRRLASYRAMPGRSLPALRGIAETVDAIWRAAGDGSTDFNYYSKRLLLAPVYGATLLYWLNDESDGAFETWAFLDRRLADVLNIGAAQGKIGRLAKILPNFVSRMVA